MGFKSQQYSRKWYEVNYEMASTHLQRKKILLLYKFNVKEINQMKYKISYGTLIHVEL